MPPKRFFANAALAAATAAITLFGLDRVMGLFGVPPAPPVQVVHPPNFKEARRTLEFAYTFQTNDRGLRERVLPLEKPPGVRRVYVAGDSFTEGYGVEDADRFTNRLTETFPGVTFVNGGLAGTGPLQYGRALRHVGLGYAPDIVLLCVYANDVVNTPPEARPADLHRRFERPTGGRRVFHVLLPHTYTLLHRLAQVRRARARPTDFTAALVQRAVMQGVPAERIRAWRAAVPDSLVRAVERGAFDGSPLSYGLLFPDYWTDALDLGSEPAERQWTATAALLDALADTAGEHGAAVGLVFLPSRFQYDAESFSPANPWVAAGCRVRRAWLTDTTAVQHRLSHWAGHRDIPFLDLTPAFRQAPDPHALTWTLDEHWTPEGHRLAADRIADWLRESGLLASRTTAPTTP